MKLGLICEIIAEKGILSYTPPALNPMYVFGIWNLKFGIFCVIPSSP